MPILSMIGDLAEKESSERGENTEITEYVFNLSVTEVIEVV